MVSGAMIYKPSFIKTGSGIKTCLGGAYTHTYTKQGVITVKNSEALVRQRTIPTERS
jgi:hypothetical protein